MQLIVVTSSDEQAGEAELLGELFRSGMRRLLVSKPSWSHDRVRVLLQSLPAGLLPHVTLDGHFGLAEELGVGGMALSDRASDEQRREFERVCRLRPTVQPCGRFHTLDGLARKADAFSEAWLSPVFESISKTGHRPPFRIEKIREAVKSLPIPAVALGGVRADRIGELARSGFSSAAVSGAIWGAGDPVEALEELREACR
jgi:thiamine-phosphate pyrophosphorylase